MKKLLLIIVVVAAVSGCEKDGEKFVFDYFTDWKNYSFGDEAFINLYNGSGHYSLIRDYGRITTITSGSGSYEKISDTKIIFSDFIVKYEFARPSFIIDSAAYDTRMSIPLLVIWYRYNLNPAFIPGDPFAIPEPIWSDEVQTEDFLLEGDWSYETHIRPF